MKFLIIVFALLNVCFSCAMPPESVSDDILRSTVIIDLPNTLDFADEKVPLEYAEVSEAIQKEVLTTMCMHTRTMLTLRMTTRYFPIIEPILKNNGVPDDFKYLCLAESGLDVNARSGAGAAGLWQFISSAAKTYGLETGANVDLRYNVELATEAACRYLKSAYRRFGSWTMAAASYNVGQAGVDRRAETQGVGNYWDMFLPDETMRYIPRILSFKLLLQNPAKYGFVLRKRDYFPPFINFRTVEVSDKEIEWSDFAAKYGTNYKVLRILNPWIRSYDYDNSTAKTYTVKIPTGGFRHLGY
ncbi:MAG: lytic transglycosylase domain-containing protein [Mucinivorans sp.]